MMPHGLIALLISELSHCGWLTPCRTHLFIHPFIRSTALRSFGSILRDHFWKGASLMTRRRGMTYVEVLVVIGLILVALAFLLPTLTRHGRHGHHANHMKCA